MCSTKGSIDTSRPHRLLQADFLSFPVWLLILKQNLALSFLSGFTVKNVKQKILEFEFGFKSYGTSGGAEHPGDPDIFVLIPSQ